jgi:pimeloyl-ACP methyl ester carboxylesterase
VAILFFATPLTAQQDKTPRKTDKKTAKQDSDPAPPLAKEKKEGKSRNSDDEPAEPEDLTLTTAGRLKLAVTYYPGSKGKESVPVILLHGFKGSRKDFTKEGGLAPYLQTELGCAVIVPDLRGHGESSVISRGSKDEKITAATLRPADYMAMVQDMRRVKDFLWEKNNRGELNLNKTCVVGVEMGASLALDYAVDDASGYEQRTPFYGLRQLQLGCFIKALVLISPEWTCKGFNAASVSRAPPVAQEYVRNRLKVLIFVGQKDGAALKEAKRVEDLFKKLRKSEPSDKSVLLGKLATSLQGIKALDHEPLRVVPVTAKFIKLQLMDSTELKNCQWKELTLPYQGGER